MKDFIDTVVQSLGGAIVLFAAAMSQLQPEPTPVPPDPTPVVEAPAPDPRGDELTKRVEQLETELAEVAERSERSMMAIVEISAKLHEVQEKLGIDPFEHSHDEEPPVAGFAVELELQLASAHTAGKPLLLFLWAPDNAENTLAVKRAVNAIPGLRDRFAIAQVDQTAMWDGTQTVAEHYALRGSRAAIVIIDPVFQMETWVQTLEDLK